MSLAKFLGSLSISDIVALEKKGIRISKGVVNGATVWNVDPFVSKPPPIHEIEIDGKRYHYTKIHPLDRGDFLLMEGRIPTVSPGAALQVVDEIPEVREMAETMGLDTSAVNGPTLIVELATPVLEPFCKPELGQESTVTVGPFGLIGDYARLTAESMEKWIDDSTFPPGSLKVVKEPQTKEVGKTPNGFPIYETEMTFEYTPTFGDMARHRKPLSEDRAEKIRLAIEDFRLGFLSRVNGHTHQTIRENHSSPEDVPHCMTGTGSHESPACHKHKCAKCGLVWIHSNMLGGLPGRTWLRYHTCACGDHSEMTKRGYSGPDEPSISHYPFLADADFEGI